MPTAPSALSKASRPGARAEARASVERLTALWALAEVALGGALHALRLPLTGLLVGGSAVVLLSLIAHAARAGGLSVRRSVLGATVVALVLKAAASPQSPVGAYVAVAFQGGLAALVLPALGRRLGPLVLGVVALAESAVQKALVLLVLFGGGLVEAVDAVGAGAQKALGLSGGASLSAVALGAYVGVHAVAGAAVGVLAGRLPGRVEALRQSGEVARLVAEARALAEARVVRAERRAWWQRPAVRRVAVVAAGLALYALLLGRGGGSAVAGVAASIARAAVVLAVWALAVAPVLLGLVRRALARRRSERAAEVARATALLPVLRALVPLAWRASAGRPGRFAALVAASALGADIEAPTDP